MKSIQPLDLIIINQLPTFASYSGRKCKLEAKIRHLFYNVKRSFICPPKKEYLRCRMIRGHKRALRHLSKKLIPNATINSFDPRNHTASRIWGRLGSAFKKYESGLLKISQTESGPKTDGKSKRKNKDQDIAKSFNSSFCKQYFKPIDVRESFYYYVELLFADLDPNVLCQKFEFNCCHGMHNPDCLEKWVLMKKYISKYLIEDLNLVPFFPSKQKDITLSNIFSEELESVLANNRRLIHFFTATKDSIPIDDEQTILKFLRS